MSDDVDRRTELLRHITKLEAVLDPEMVECQDCGAVLHRPATVSPTDTATVLRERRQSLAELAALDTVPVNEPEEVDDDAAAARRAKMREANTGASAPSPRRRQPRRSSGRNRTG